MRGVPWRVGSADHRAARRTGCPSSGVALAAAGLIVALALAARPAHAEWWSFPLGTFVEVKAIRADRAGMIWVATPHGAMRYDGLEWRTFTTADGLVSDDVTCILEDRTGALWFGTSSGLSRFDGTSWTTYSTAQGLVSNHIWNLIEDRQGDIWVATSLGASRFDGTGWTTHQPGVWIFVMHEDRNGAIWLGSRGAGLIRLEAGTWSYITVENTPDALITNNVLAIGEDREGGLWVSSGVYTQGFRLSRLFKGAWTTPIADLGDGAVSSILPGRDGKLWITTFNEGLRSFDGEHWRTYTRADGLAGEAYTCCLAEDRSGALWVGDLSGWVNRFDKGSWKPLAPPPGTEIFSPGLEDRDGNLWFGLWDAGVGRWDGTAWSVYTVDDGLAIDFLVGSLLDRDGNVWFTNNGLSRWNGKGWARFGPEGFSHPAISWLHQDRTGGFWVGTVAGVNRFDGTMVWDTLTSEDGLASDFTSSVVEDRDGVLWFATPSGVSRHDPATGAWRTYTTEDGLADDQVRKIVIDRTGVFWFATLAGLTRWDGGTGWRTYTVADGLPADNIEWLMEGRGGDLWLQTFAGTCRFDGERFTTFRTERGAPVDPINPLFVDRGGSVWFSSNEGRPLRYDPDRVPPATQFLVRPPAVSSSRSHAATFIPAYRETRGITFSHRLDDGPWSDWSQYGTWSVSDLPDGRHVLEARTRDHEDNVDPLPARAEFLIDAAPPVPIIAEPAFGQPVRGAVEVRGTAADPRFASYTLEARSSGPSSSDPPPGIPIAEGSAPVSGGRLGTWKTDSLPDGPYDLRLAVTDSLGLTGVAQSTVIVDNQFPFADVTAPARIVATTGGDIYTTNSEVHLYFPPGAFSADALVIVGPNASGSVPDSLPSGATRVCDGFEISWGAAALSKPARLELALGDAIPSGTHAVYTSGDGMSWQRLGGTRENEGRRIAVPISAGGRFAVFSDAAGTDGIAATLSAISFTPRVFSPTGTFADRQVSIGFTLGRSAAVTVRVFNRAGWLVKDVAVGQTFGHGTNLVRWDGTDRDGAIVPDGLYLVTVEALGEVERRPLAVVR